MSCKQTSDRAFPTDGWLAFNLKRVVGKKTVNLQGLVTTYNMLYDTFVYELQT